MAAAAAAAVATGRGLAVHAYGTFPCQSVPRSPCTARPCLTPLRSLPPPRPPHHQERCQVRAAGVQARLSRAGWKGPSCSRLAGSEAPPLLATGTEAVRSQQRGAGAEVRRKCSTLKAPSPRPPMAPSPPPPMAPSPPPPTPATALSASRSSARSVLRRPLPRAPQGAPPPCPAPDGPLRQTGRRRHGMRRECRHERRSRGHPVIPMPPPRAAQWPSLPPLSRWRALATAASTHAWRGSMATQNREDHRDSSPPPPPPLRPIAHRRR